MLEIRDITKVYNPGTITEQRLFDHFSLKVEEGQFVAIVGSNGSGKTSLLNIICGSIPIEGGDVLVGGTSISKLKDYQRYATMGRVYQNPAAGTCPNLTMLENLSLADNKGKSFGLSRAINRRRVEQYREQLLSLGLGLEDKLDVKMGALSGGQRQAVSLLMATMTPLKFLILDEHTAALDPKTADTIMRLTDQVVREKKLTALMVTHNLRYAVEYGDRVLMMDRGHVVLDRAGEEKRNTSIDDILTRFNQISIECGNETGKARAFGPGFSFTGIEKAPRFAGRLLYVLGESVWDGRADQALTLSLFLPVMASMKTAIAPSPVTLQAVPKES